MVTCKEACDTIRHTVSFFLTLGSLGLILYCLAKNYAALPGEPWLHYILFFFSLILLAYLEGLQVAILSLEHVSPTTFPPHAIRARASHRLATAQRGLNVQRFLVGRQFFVVFVVFLAAQLTTYPGLPKDAMPKWLYVAVINTGLPGALVVLAFGQLMPQLIAATHPVTMMNCIGSYQVISLALGFEFIGITHFSWALAEMVKKLCGLNKPGSALVGCRDPSGNPNDDSNTINPSPGSWSTSPLKPLLDNWSNIRSKMDLDIGSLDTPQLYQGAERGLEASSTSDIRSREMVAWLQTQSMSGSRNLSSLYEGHRNTKKDNKSIHGKGGIGVKSNEEDLNNNLNQFPSPADITRFLIRSKRPVPRYLLPPHHGKHIPPHIVAFDLIRRHDQVTQRVMEYQRNDLQVANTMSVLQQIYETAPRGKYPDLDVLMSDRIETGDNKTITTASPMASTFMSPTLEPLLNQATMPELALSEEQFESFAEYRQKYHDFRKGKAQGSDGEVKKVLSVSEEESVSTFLNNNKDEVRRRNSRCGGGGSSTDGS